MLVKTIMNASQLKEEFVRCNRDYYSYSACEEIIRLFEECYPEPVELDIIGLCGDLNEENWEYIKDQYSNHEDIANAKDMSELLDALNYHTWAVETIDNNILYQVW